MVIHEDLEQLPESYEPGTSEALDELGNEVFPPLTEQTEEQLEETIEAIGIDLEASLEAQIEAGGPEAPLARLKLGLMALTYQLLDDLHELFENDKDEEAPARIAKHLDDISAAMEAADLPSKEMKIIQKQTKKLSEMYKKDMDIMFNTPSMARELGATVLYAIPGACEVTILCEGLSGKGANGEKLPAWRRIAKVGVELPFWGVVDGVTIAAAAMSFGAGGAVVGGAAATAKSARLVGAGAKVARAGNVASKAAKASKARKAATVGKALGEGAFKAAVPGGRGLIALRNAREILKAGKGTSAAVRGLGESVKSYRVAKMVTDPIETVGEHTVAKALDAREAQQHLREINAAQEHMMQVAEDAFKKKT